MYCQKSNIFKAQISKHGRNKNEKDEIGNILL
jgi:hypothetical protein